MPENPLNTITGIDPKVVEKMRSTDDWVFKDGALPKKVKLLMAMAFDAADGTVSGVRAIARQAMNKGATKEEIGEALRVAYLMKGVGPVYVASEALTEIFP